MHWNPLDELVEECAFSGVVRVRRQGQPMYERAAGFADRANSIAAVLSNTSAGAWPIARAIDDVLGKEDGPPS